MSDFAEAQKVKQGVVPIINLETGYSHMNLNQKDEMALSSDNRQAQGNKPSAFHARRRTEKSQPSIKTKLTNFNFSRVKK